MYKGLEFYMLRVDLCRKMPLQSEKKKKKSSKPGTGLK